MAVSYKKLFHMLIDRNMTAAELQKKAGYSANISTRMRRDEYVSLDSIEKICRVLGCKVDDIVDFIPDEDKVSEK
ncbi:helix-turn-helix domain-containing protein [Lachnoclostridium sp. Marseille-P6806]|uniref:helix-turn-helix domain-containing protein n=1 Tax=Lachnoclostridium sp. Marseille-P6806 TaxID=2364793 RepID=UPI001031C82E|nr:helix-turn-helix transcriptional regulator [Lachnoclostridium sp. Marseille-P6806]